MQRLIPHVQHYPWGSPSAIPEMLGVEPDGRPWAELWIGDHPRLPSTVEATGEPLDAGLPFLLKVLASAEPLSIQTHPSLERAIAGYERENAAGIPLDAPHRTYRDPNHKPELICALTPFDALVGFREPAAIMAEYASIEPLAPLLARLDGERALQSAIEWLLRMPADEVTALVGAVAPQVELVALLDSFHPGDRGALVGLLLHRIRLQPGEAVFLGAGNLHAYVSGVGVEIMANSDNVIRGGLTSKHIDIDELLDVVSFDAFEPDVQRASGAIHTFTSPGSGFELTRFDQPDGERLDAADDELVLGTSGAVQMRCSDGSHALIEPGTAVFVPAGSAYTLRGAGVAWRATAEG